MPSSSILRDEAVLRRLPKGDMSSMIQKRFLAPVAVGIEMVLPGWKKGIDGLDFDQYDKQQSNSANRSSHMPYQSYT